MRINSLCIESGELKFSWSNCTVLCEAKQSNIAVVTRWCKLNPSMRYVYPDFDGIKRLGFCVNFVCTDRILEQNIYGRAQKNIRQKRKNEITIRSDHLWIEGGQNTYKHLIGINKSWSTDTQSEKKNWFTNWEIHGQTQRLIVLPLFQQISTFFQQYTSISVDSTDFLRTSLEIPHSNFYTGENLTITIN